MLHGRHGFGRNFHSLKKGSWIVLENLKALEAAKLRHVALMKHLGKSLAAAQGGETDQAFFLARALAFCVFIFHGHDLRGECTSPPGACASKKENVVE
jgi:hypothetical protein